MWSTTPPEGGFAFADISADVAAATPALDVVVDHRGLAVVDAYTVAHESGVPRYATVLGRTDDDAAWWCAATTPSSRPTMAGEEWCGREVTVDGDRFETPA